MGLSPNSPTLCLQTCATRLGFIPSASPGALPPTRGEPALPKGAVVGGVGTCAVLLLACRGGDIQPGHGMLLVVASSPSEMEVLVLQSPGLTPGFPTVTSAAGAVSWVV